MQRCATCDAQNRDGVRFCTSCGSGHLVLELDEAAVAEPELELQSPPALASACWRGERRPHELDALRAVVPLGTVEPFGRSGGWAGFRSSLGSDPAELLGGLPVRADAPDRAVDMHLPGGEIAGVETLPALWDRVRLADARASGTPPTRPSRGIPAGTVEASRAEVAEWRTQSGFMSGHGVR